MNRERKNHTLVALPDGRILAMGGNKYNSVKESKIRHQPEVYDPAVPLLGWQYLSENPVPDDRIGRGYHSTALLLPDASVVFAGGELDGVGWAIQLKAQFFSPNYGGTEAWRDTNPNLSAAPATVRYDENFTVNYAVHSGRTLSKVRLISLGATTHAFNQNQVVRTLSFTTNAGVATITPPTVNQAPPGYYMLFAVDSLGIPSEAAIVQLMDFARAFPYSVAVGAGTWVGTTLVVADAVLGDNNYLGDGLNSVPNDPAEASATLSGKVKVGTEYTKIRVTLETRTSPTTSLEIKFKNWVTGNLDLMWTESSTGTDTEITRTHTSSGASPYVRTSDGEVQASLYWREVGGNAFIVSLVKFEWGVR
jgi:hypothetical protein